MQLVVLLFINNCCNRFPSSRLMVFPLKPAFQRTEDVWERVNTLQPCSTTAGIQGAPRADCITHLFSWPEIQKDEPEAWKKIKGPFFFWWVVCVLYPFMLGRFSDGRSFVSSKEWRISTLIQHVEHQVSYLHDTQDFCKPYLGNDSGLNQCPRPTKCQESGSKWKALNLRKVKDAAPAESVGASKMGFSGKVMELEILPKQPIEFTRVCRT